MGKKRKTAMQAVGNNRKMDFPAVGNFREFGGGGLQKCPRMVSVFFANLESEAAAAKGACFGSTQTAFPAQRSLLPGTPAEGILHSCIRIMLFRPFG